MRSAAALLLTALLVAGTAWAQEQTDAVPDPGAPPGAVATARVDRPFDRYALPVAAFGGEAEPLRDVEGRVVWSAYRLDDAEASAASVMAGYRERLGALGFTPVLDCATTACGGFDFRFGVQLLPAPSMLLDAAEFQQLTAEKTAGDGGKVFASVLVSRVLGAIRIQTVVVVPAQAAPVPAPVEGVDAAPAPGPLPDDGVLMAERLVADGHVALRGLEFGSGTAELSEASTPVLERAAKMLKDHPELSVMVVGHSDNQGAPDQNTELSLRRAETVRNALVGLGIDAGRLDARGAGFLAPVTTNATAEGRARNRRVELVLR